MTFQAKILYEFAGELSGELTVGVGDIITVTNPDVGQGWLLGIREDGKEGFVPNHYVERLPDQVYTPSAPILKNMSDCDKDKLPADKTDIQTEMIDIGQESGARTGLRPPLPNEGQRLSRVNLTNVFGKSDAVCAYLMGITDPAVTLVEETVYINEPSNGYFQWVS